MGIKVFYSDRIEDLAEAMKARLLKERSVRTDPFIFTEVVVPNANVAKWLKLRQFASEPKLSAGINFPFMEQRLTELLSDNLRDKKYFERLPDHSYAIAIMNVLLTCQSQDFAVFRRYIGGGDGGGALEIKTQKEARMAWQLADKIAGLMDQYEVRRPELVEKWLAKNPDGKFSYSARGEIEIGEVALARALWGDEGVFSPSKGRLSLRQLFEQVRREKPAGPKASGKVLYFFAQATLSLLQAEILVWLSMSNEVIVYHLNPCREFWGDIESDREARKINLDRGFDPEIENALLNNLGIAGRETVNLLVDLESDMKTGLICEEVVHTGDFPSNVLNALQSSIRNRKSRVCEKIPQDASIQIVGTPGVRREVEMVYNSILGSVVKPSGVTGDRPWPDCSFSDIAILVPDMKTYRPMIESVFEARGQIPYALIDTSASDESQYLAGFGALLELGRKGLNRESLFNVLQNPCVSRALNYTAEDIAQWRELTETIGAFNGFEAVDEEDKFNWQWALKRLRLSGVTESMTIEDGGGEFDLELSAIGNEQAQKFAEVVELLWREIDLVFSTGNLRLLNNYLEVAPDDPLEKAVQSKVVLILNALDGLGGDYNVELLAAAVLYFAGGVPCRRGGYLTHGVTIASPKSLHLVPFKQVYVLGLIAGGFPGKTSGSTLDLRGLGQRLGDVSPVIENRYIFLTAMMSARDRLVITYPNRDIEKDAELFPSGLVLDLEKFLTVNILSFDESSEEKKRVFREFKNYPLLERGENDALDKDSPVSDILWNSHDPLAGLLHTYSKEVRKLAQGYFEKPSIVLDTSPSAEIIEVDVEFLAQFIKSPLRAVMRHRFGIAVDGYVDGSIESDSPLGIPSGSVLWDIQSVFLETGDFTSIKNEFRKKQFTGHVASGFLGAFAENKMMENVEKNVDALKNFICSFKGTSDFTSPFSLRIVFHRLNVALTAVIQHWNEKDNQISVLTMGKIDSKIAFPPERTLAPFLSFLIRQASEKSDIPRTLRVGVVDLDAGKCMIWRWENITPIVARDYLENLLTDYLACENDLGKTGCIDLKYLKYVKSLPNDCSDLDKINWDGLLSKVAAEEYSYDGDFKFNNDLVIEKVAKSFGRNPNIAELKALHEKRYALILKAEGVSA